MEATTQETKTDNQNQSSAPKIKKFLGVKPFSEKHSDWKESQLRWLIFNRETNGFKSVFRKIGRRVLIDETAFFAKIDESAM